jgi:hypothetical protein
MNNENDALIKYNSNFNIFRFNEEIKNDEFFNQKLNEWRVALSGSGHYRGASLGASLQYQM